LLKAAKKEFSEKGGSASLEEIARKAGVGIGTLYRNFPTREALIDEIFGKKRDQLVEAAERLARERPPLEAVREWLLLFIEYLANKEIMAEILNTLTKRHDPLCVSSGEKLVEALATLLERGKRSGDIIQKVEPLDLLCAITGIASFVAEPEWESSARRLVGIALSGLRRRS
jgi:AcrR family transcriptional regulator